MRSRFEVGDRVNLVGIFAYTVSLDFAGEPVKTLNSYSLGMVNDAIEPLPSAPVLWYKKTMRSLLGKLMRFAGYVSPEVLVVIQQVIHVAGHALGLGHIETGAGGP